MSKKTTLSVEQVLLLEAEISGVAVGQDVKMKGLLRQSLSQVTKYHLMRLLRTLEPIKEDFMKLRNEIIKKYGVAQEDGTYKMEDHEFFNKELVSLLKVTHEIEHHEFKIEDLEVETDEFYPMMYTLIG